MQQETEIDFRLRDASDLREGNLRVGATGPFYIMDTVRRYNQRYPGIDLTLVIGNSQSMLQALHDYQIEIATSSFLMDDKHLYRRLIAADPIRVVTHRDHPLAARPCVAGRPVRTRPAVARARLDDAPAHRGSAATGRRQRAPHAGDRQPRVDPAGHPERPGDQPDPLARNPFPSDLAALDIEGAEIVMHEYLYCLRERQPVQLIARFLEMAPAAG